MQIFPTIITIGLAVLLIRTIIIMVRHVLKPPPASTQEDNGYYGDGVEVSHAVSEIYYFHTMEQADKHIATKEYNKALALLEYLNRNYVSHEAVHSRMAWIYSELNDVANAQLHYSALCTLAPDNTDYSVNLAFCYLLQQQYAAAKDIYDEVIKTNRNVAYILANRGLAKVQMGDMDGGITDITEAIRTDPDEAYAHRSIGIYNLLQHRKAEALQAFEHAKKLNADCFEIDEYLAQARL